MIKLNDLAIGYSGEAILEHIDQEFDDGLIYGILAKSGAGKTTLLKTIAGLLRPVHGKVIIDGTTYRNADKNPVYMMHQRYSNFGWLSCTENVLIAQRDKKLRNRNDAIKVLAAVGLEQYADIVTPKTSAGVRIVPMLSEVKAALQAEWETQKIVGFNESVVDGYTGFIFQNRYGDPLSPHSVNRAIDRICAAYIEDETVLADQEGRDPVLIRHFSAHNLRHTFCTRFCENERNIKVIQEIMGHADIETTMNIYAEATKEKKKESFSNLEGKIKIS